MTSEELKQILLSAAKDKTVRSEIPLWEIAYQLAVMNERNDSGDRQAVDEILKKVGLASTGRADSDKTVRGDTQRSQFCHQTFSPGHSHCCHCGLDKKYWKAATDCLGRIEAHEDVKLFEQYYMSRPPRTADERTTHPNPQTTTSIPLCPHDRLDEDGVCRACKLKPR